MFTSGNFYNDGIEYDYDKLNELLNAELDTESPTYEDDVKNVSDSLNNAMSERDGKIWIGDVVVGEVIDE
jgi:hypothetical protein